MTLKHTWANRPKRKRHHIPEMGYEWYYDEDELDEWFEGFGKELLSKLNETKEALKTAKNPARVGWNWQKGLLEEILGVSEV